MQRGMGKGVKSFKVGLNDIEKQINEPVSNDDNQEKK